MGEAVLYWAQEVGVKLTDAINYIVERNRQVVNACYKRSTCVGVHQVHIPYKNHMTGDKHRRDNRNRHANQRPGEDQNYGASISRIVTASMANFRFLLAWVADMICVSETNQF